MGCQQAKISKDRGKVTEISRRTERNTSKTSARPSEDLNGPELMENFHNDQRQPAIYSNAPKINPACQMVNMLSGGINNQLVPQEVVSVTDCEPLYHTDLSSPRGSTKQLRITIEKQTRRRRTVTKNQSVITAEINDKYQPAPKLSAALPIIFSHHEDPSDQQEDLSSSLHSAGHDMSQSQAVDTRQPPAAQILPISDYHLKSIVTNQPSIFKQSVESEGLREKMRAKTFNSTPSGGLQAFSERTRGGMRQKTGGGSSQNRRELSPTKSGSLQVPQNIRIAFPLDNTRHSQQLTSRFSSPLSTMLDDITIEEIEEDFTRNRSLPLSQFSMFSLYAVAAI